ncbi:MAG: hypothetical protein NVS2B16_30620 [Chloroflexota bacterium]
MTEPETPDRSTLTIVAGATEDRRRVRVFAAAVEAAKTENARLILHDVDSPSPWTEPVSDLGNEGYRQPMNDVELRHRSRTALADRVEEARSQEVQAWVWMSSNGSAEAMID